MKIIAECGANHCGSRELMSKMIQEAAKVGVDIVKFQSWRADKLRKDWPDYDNAYAYYKKHELSESDHRFLIKQCRKHGIGFLTSVFDLDTVDLLRRLDIDTVKIASPDANNWALINKCLANFKHVIISIGMHCPEEVVDLIEHLDNVKDKVTIMHCISLYPTPPDKANLGHIKALCRAFPSVGFSDHTAGTDAAKIALCYGIDYLEKHYTLDRTLPGKDQAMSAVIDEFKEIVAWRDKIIASWYSPGFHDEGARSYIGKWG